ncbi:MAG: LacI family DNA-binding transcriptional regulator [Pseudochelatococcus sp.]|jgi:DNA-binding LacI/PurR family transcriptional regulator|uniref:LacI family DNA-binding transcriptional regulator n=1 Tax=Pseudochelatococcus sp. TaxID=2020869 RepID=UPI003D93DF86
MNAPDGRPRFVTAQHVAEHAGVSRSAVSRAFTPGASIAADTREKVMRAAEALGYQVNDLARGLLANRSRLVGMVVTGMEVGFRAHLTAALSRVLIARGSIPLLINTGLTPEEMAAAQKILLGHRAEAIVVLSGSPPASFIDIARRNGQPIIVIGRSEPDADHVQIDNDAAAREAARLFAARGFTRLAVAGSLSRTPNLLERERAFADEARQAGIETTIARGRDSTYAGGVDAAQALFDGGARPRAVFCVNDLMALGLIDQARRRGLAVPGDVDVIGFDDLPEAGWQNYGLTTFRQDPAAMALAAVELLERRQAQPACDPARARLAAPLMVRSSFVPV